ncbi:hypothetical protein B0H16DRAFT_1629860, partial [Mycena metata]
MMNYSFSFSFFLLVSFSLHTYSFFFNARSYTHKTYTTPHMTRHDTYIHPHLQSPSLFSLSRFVLYSLPHAHVLHSLLASQFHPSIIFFSSSV